MTFEALCNSKNKPPYDNEPDARVDFMRWAQDCGMFKVYAEVAGHPMFRRASHTKSTDFRVDFLLVPLDSRVQTGAIAVEVKSPGSNIGSAINQAMDYVNAVFFIPDTRVAVVPSISFVFPFAQQFGAVKSMMDSSRVGSINFPHYGSQWCQMRFRYGNGCLIKMSRVGGVVSTEVNTNVLATGRKRGSR